MQGLCRRERLPNVSSRPAARGRGEGPARQINTALSLPLPCPTGARCCRHTQMVQTRNIFLAAAVTQPCFPCRQPPHLSSFQTAAQRPVSLQLPSLSSPSFSMFPVPPLQLVLVCIGFVDCSTVESISTLFAQNLVPSGHV